MMSNHPTPQPKPLHPGAGLSERPVRLPDGRRLRTVVAGRGPGPLVVFEAGMSAPAAEWVTVQRMVAADARTLAYDRAGYGGSDDDDHDRTLERLADDLRALLDVLDERAPVVVVAHSWGGPIVRVFADRHPDRVAAVVFVDSTLSVAIQPQHAAQLRLSFRLTSLLIRLRLVGLMRKSLLPYGPGDGVTEDDMTVLWRDYASVRAMRTGRREAEHIAAARERMLELEAAGVPDVPVIALQAGRPAGGAVARRFRAEFDAMARRLVEAQPRAELRIVDDSGHLIPQERPDAVREAIMDVIRRAAQPPDASKE
ncbi:alpha/beta fold hydrolase [Microbacterium sp. NPDC058342]|uniref:alpha/beta fold hydrolase n=1 Tax=Microbacterium sp. NPDC058342 TaxID=3346454 RepID=UPI0036591CC2